MARVRSWHGDGDQGREGYNLPVGLQSVWLARTRPYASTSMIWSVTRRPPRTLHSGFLQMGSLRVHHTHGGRGSPVLFIHGLGSSGYLEGGFNLEAAARPPPRLP